MQAQRDRKSTRLNSSHLVISYAVFCLKKKHTRISRVETPTGRNPPAPRHRKGREFATTASRVAVLHVGAQGAGGLCFVFFFFLRSAPPPNSPLFPPPPLSG